MKVYEVKVLLTGREVAVLTLAPGEKRALVELDTPAGFDAVEVTAVDEEEVR